MFLESFAPLFRFWVKARDESGEEARFWSVLLLKNHDGLFNFRVRVESGLDFTKLYAVAAELDLMVHAAEELQGSISSSTHAITGEVKAFRFTMN